MYRFAGLNGNEGIKNYICLGTDSCSSGSDNMYRIIGVNPTNGELKVVKETPWNNSQTYTWHNTDEEITWDKSDLYNNTVKLIYDNLAFKNIIVLNHVWGIGAMNVEDVATRKGILSLENASTMLANVNILSVADYYLAYNADRNWRTSYDTTTNWIDMHQNILSPTNDEWTMSFYGYWENTFPSYKSWAIDYIYGGISRYGGDSKGNIRPTFYIQPIEYISGDGSKENPFIVE